MIGESEKILNQKPLEHALQIFPFELMPSGTARLILDRLLEHPIQGARLVVRCLVTEIYLAHVQIYDLHEFLLAN